jgi:hypothetical protein
MMPVTVQICVQLGQIQGESAERTRVLEHFQRSSWLNWA